MKEVKVYNNNHFYKRLFIYKSFLCKNIFFKTQSEDYQFNGIINALNIKNKKKRIEYIYDFSCEYIEKHNEGKNICGFENGVCRYHQEIECDIKNGCCSLCQYQSSNGCQTSNLSCKLFYCSSAKKFDVVRSRDLRILKLLSIRRRIIAKNEFFSSREQILTDLYLGSIIVYCVKMTARVIKVLINLKTLKKVKS